MLTTLLVDQHIQAFRQPHVGASDAAVYAFVPGFLVYLFCRDGL